MSEGPQTEDGFVRIANELHDAILVAGFSKRELLALFAIIRKTYGYGKVKDDMTMTQLAKATALQLPHVSATIRDLEAKGVITVEPGVYGKVIGVIKNHKKWRLDAVTKTVSYDRNGHVSKTVTKVTETVTVHDQNSQQELPKQSFAVTETVNTKDNPKRQLQKTTPKDSCDGVAVAPSIATWSAYAEAYRERYGIEPVRNAKVNGQLAQLVARVGGQEAPGIARFYVGHNNRYYVSRGHAVDALLRDCEHLRTEWLTGQRMTETAARQVDATEAQGQVWNRLLQKVQAQ